MPAHVDIIALPAGPAGVRRFLRAGRSVYDGDPHYVAPLASDQRKIFLPSNPFLEHGSMQLWVAEREGRDVGRVAGIMDQLYRERHDGQTAFFGFFEAETDPQISRELFATAAAWARKEGFTRLLGPVNPTSNDECGLLVDGFDDRPCFMMPYNPPYYADRFRESGLEKSMDLLAYHLDLTRLPHARLDRIRARFHRRQPDIRFRPLRRRTFSADLEKIRHIYNLAWEDNWGFVPMTGGEIDFMARRLKPLLVEGLVWIAETEREPIGFLLAVPDFNEALQPLQGRLLTPRVLGLLPYLWGWKVPARCRVIVLGVHPDYRGKGVEAALLAEGLRTGRELGLQSCEASWILENNHKIRRVIEALDGQVYRTYRLFEKAI